MTDDDDYNVWTDPHYDHYGEVIKRSVSNLARKCVEEEGCDPLSVAKAARNISFVLSECNLPELHYSFLKAWHEIADRSLQRVAVERRKRSKVLDGLDKASTRH